MVTIFIYWSHYCKYTKCIQKPGRHFSLYFYSFRLSEDITARVYKHKLYWLKGQCSIKVTATTHTVTISHCLALDMSFFAHKFSIVNMSSPPDLNPRPPGPSFCPASVPCCYSIKVDLDDASCKSHLFTNLSHWTIPSTGHWPPCCISHAVSRAFRLKTWKPASYLMLE